MRNSSVEDLEMQQMPVNLHYLHGIELKKIIELTEQYHQSAAALEDTLAHYRWTYHYYRIRNAIGNLSMLYSIVFLVDTSAIGIQQLARIISHSEISDFAAKAIGIPCAILGTVPLIFAISPQWEAAKATLHYSTQAPLLERLKNKTHLAYNNPCLAARHALQYLAKQAILLPSNATGAVASVIGFSPRLEQMNSTGKWVTTGLIFFPQYVFYRLYYNLKKGLDYFQNQKYSWLPQQIYNFDFAIPSQVIIQGLVGAVGLRIYPFYYSIAKSANNIMPFWFPVTVVGAAVALQGLLTLYVATREHYELNSIKINDIFANKFQNRVKAFVESTHLHSLIPLSAKEIEKRTRQCLQGLRAAEDAVFKRSQPCGYIIRAYPLMIGTIGYRAFIGGFLGFQIAPMIFASTAVTTICAVGGAILLGELLRRAEFRRIHNELFLKHLEPEKNPLSVIKKSSKEKITIAVGMMMTIATGLTNAMSTLGTAENTSLFTTTVIALLAGERMINTILFNQGITTTLKSIFVPVRISTVPAVLFSRRSQSNLVAAADEKKVYALGN